MTDDLIARLRCYPANRLCRQVADALEEITASREAVWKHAKMLEKDLLAHKERIAELEAALKIYAEARCSGMICAFDDGEAARAALGENE